MVKRSSEQQATYAYASAKIAACQVCLFVIDLPFMMAGRDDEIAREGKIESVTQLDGTRFIGRFSHSIHPFDVRISN